MAPKKHHYLAVDDEDTEGADVQHRYTNPRHALSVFTLSLGLLAVLLVGAIGGFYVGSLYIRRTTEENSAVQESPIILDPVTVKFTSNRAFLQRPSKQTEELWKTLYPKDTHGLFEYPDNNPERSGFAAFHQLHCVDALRRGYYQREDVIGAIRAKQSPPEFEHEVDETHTLHCIEFLRQSIMCHADTTVQTEATYHQGILAFGVEYQCKNWWQLVDWVDRRNEQFPPSKQ